ncbi:MAG: MMPL family transporter [Pseudomonadales bacterium]
MYRNLLISWTNFVINRPWQILTAISLVTLLALYISITQFSINSNTAELIRQNTPWKKVHRDFMKSFPQYANNTFVVVSGKTLSSVSSVSKSLEAQLLSKSDIFQLVYSPANDKFLDSHALLFVDPEDLDALVSNLADAQPILSSVAHDPNVRGLFGLLSNALNGGEDVPDSMAGFATLLADNIDRTLAGNGSPVAWRDELVKRDSDEDYYNIIFVQGRQNFGENLPNAQLLQEIRSIIDGLQHPSKDLVEIRLTGQVPLDNGEVQSAIDSAQLAASIAAVFLMFILIFGVGSIRIIVATYMTMAIGLIWTSAYAILVVGQYNTISIIFLVMFIGLGVDFAIHLSLRYQEDLLQHDTKGALVSTNRDLGPAITLCGITSAIGFLSFVPTEYVGLAELGIISGGGMLIAVFVSLTVIPAFFTVVKKPVAMPQTVALNSISELLHQYRHAIIAVTFVIGGLAAYVAKDTYFDYSTLSLKNQGSEAMTTFRDLQERDVITDYAISYVAPDMETARRVKQKLLTLATVSDVKIPADYVPNSQEEKLYILEDAQFMLASTFYGQANKTRYGNDERTVAIDRLFSASTRFIQSSGTNDSKLLAAIHHLNNSLGTLKRSEDHLKIQFEDNVIPPLLLELQWLNRAINVGEIQFNDLPRKLIERIVSKDGEVLVTITPSQDIVPVKAMREFTTEVQGVVEHATGRLITELGVGDIVIASFKTAISIAVISIFVILLIALGSIIDTVLVFIPLAITTLITLAFSVAMNMPLNMANVVVLPLIFGLGVDNGIHVVERFHESASLEKLMLSSTPRAVLLSTLTTLGTFGALSFSDHQGIYSIGVLLTCALSTLMIMTLIALPALLDVFSRRQANRRSTA